MAPVTAIHPTPLEAVHVHPGGADTVMVNGPPPSPTAMLVGATVNAHPLAWLTVNVCPPMVIVAERAAVVFASAANCTVPFPVPVAPEVTVSHCALLAAVHVQPGPAVTATVPVPPPAAMLVLSGTIVTEPPLAWFSVKVWSAIVNVADRAAPAVASTL
jgi:hypothetical protein